MSGYHQQMPRRSRHLRRFAIPCKDPLRNTGGTAFDGTQPSMGYVSIKIHAGICETTFLIMLRRHLPCHKTCRGVVGNWSRPIRTETGEAPTSVPLQLTFITETSQYLLIGILVDTSFFVEEYYAGRIQLQADDGPRSWDSDSVVILCLDLVWLSNSLRLESVHWSGFG